MLLHYKIQSCSSQFISLPASNLVARSGAWQSERFCDYPQQLTLSFYHPVMLKSIKIVAHPTKVPTRINILYHLSQHDDKDYQRYGYITFSQPKEGNIVSEVKQIGQVNVRATEVRFMLLRNHHTKSNFFNQVSLTGLQFYGQEVDHVMPVVSKSRTKGFEHQVTLLMQLKHSFVKREQFEEAKQVKQMELVLQRANEQIQQLQKEKLRCVKEQDFEGAKKVRDELFALRAKVSDLATKFYDPQGQIRMIKSDVALKQKIEEMNLTSKSSTFRMKQSRKKTNQDEPLQDVGQVESEEEDKVIDQFDQSRVSYDDRILPAVINKMRGSMPNPIVQANEIGDNEFFDSEQKNNLPQEPQTMGPADQANSSMLLDFYQPLFIRKLHSKYWQFRLEAITQATDELKGSADPNFLTKQRLRSILFIYSHSLKLPNFKTNTAVLQMMDILLQNKSQPEPHKQLHNQLQAVMKATLKILADSNQKIRMLAQKTILRMIQSPIFGVHACYSGLIKNYPEKGMGRLRKIRIQNLIQLVEKYGVGQQGVPQSIADFALKASNDPEADVRKSAVQLMRAIKGKGGKQKLQNLMSDSRIRGSVARQIAQ